MPTLAPATLVRVRPLVESRPPAVTWRPVVAWPASRDQPPLDLNAYPEVDLARPSGREVTSTVIRPRWMVRPRHDLPDACEWGATLSLAVLQALLAQRPLAQLNRWLAEDVLSMVSLQQRRHRLEHGRAVRPVLVRSIRVQHPGAEVAEVSAHVVVGARGSALAFRLEALGDRWLCTALEFDPRVVR